MTMFFFWIGPSGWTRPGDLGYNNLEFLCENRLDEKSVRPIRAGYEVGRFISLERGIRPRSVRK